MRIALVFQTKPGSYKTELEKQVWTELTRAVRQKYLRDDVSRQTPGKNNTIIKKQRRLLCDSRKNRNHRKCVAEHEQNISYAFFCRPFWVVTPNDRDRETCQCKTHENLQFMVEKIHKLVLSHSSNVEEMADSIVCNNVFLPGVEGLWQSNTVALC